MVTMHNKCPMGQSFNAQQTKKWRGKLERKMRYVKVINKQKKIDQWAFNGPKSQQSLCTINAQWAAHLIINRLKREREKMKAQSQTFGLYMTMRYGQAQIQHQAHYLMISLKFPINYKL